MDSPTRARRHRTFTQKWALITLPNKIMVIATVAIAAATVVNLLVSGGMWIQMQRTNDIAQDALKKGQRPWVGPAGSQISGPIQIKGDEVTVLFDVTVRNYGASPAVHTQVWANWFTSEAMQHTDKYSQELTSFSDRMCDGASDDLKKLYGLPSDAPRYPKSGATVFPNSTFTQAQGTQAVNNPKYLSSLFRIVGCIVYGDQFGATIHRSRFCYESGEKASNISQSSNLHPCDVNETEE